MPINPPAAADDSNEKIAALHVSILNALPAHIALLNSEGVIISVNQSWRCFAESNGIQCSTSCIGTNYLKICERAQGDSAKEAHQAAAGIRSVLAGAVREFSLEYPCHTPAEHRWFQLMVTPLEKNLPTGVAVMHINITERKLAEFRLHRLNRLHTVLSKVGEAIKRIRERQELFEAVCHIVVEVGLLRMAFIAELDAAGNIARPVASYGEGREYLNEPTCVFPTHEGPLSMGPVGTSLRTGAPDFCTDIAGDSRMKPWQETARKNNFLANAAFPLHLSGATIGTLVLYACEKGYFLEDEIRVMVSVAADVSFALESLEKEQQRQLAEEQLLSKTALLEAQINSTLDGILVVDAEGKKVLQNQRLLDLWSNPSVLADDVDRQDRIEWVTRKVKNSQVFVDKIAWLYANPDKISRDELKLNDGRYLDHYSAPVRCPSGKNHGRIWAFRDITEQKRIEARFRRLIDSNAQSVFFWNTRGGITDANDAFLNLVGYSREDLQSGRIRWSELTPPQYADLDRRALEEIAAKGTSTPYEKEYVRKDGSRVAILIGAATFEDNPNEGVCFLLDITERKKLEQQFLRAQRMESIGTLAGGVAHDLNNILAPIMMSIDILKLSVTDPQAREILQTIEVSSKRGADIVRQVLSFARGLQGERIEVQPKHLLKDIETLIRDTFPKNIRQELSLPDDPWTIVGDPTQLHQILLNLCVNGRDAMPQGGKLSLKVENCVLDEQYVAMNSQAKPGRYVVISVTDTGTGMPPDVIDKIFEPFFTTKEVGKGTGLGLSTVMGIVKSHEGVINVYSELGKGTTFRVYLPAVEHSSDEQIKPTQLISLPRGNGEVILIVDDEASILTITSQTLQAFGYRILTATDGADAIAVYTEHKQDIAVVITDMMMPLMDGASTIRALTRINPAIKIIAASGLNATGGAAKEAGLGVKHSLTKPYSAETLLKALRAVLEEA
jgi:PAS domain S-box-containing protein